ncbi:MAG: trypsin-like serine protease, partial [FCB group bacterium]|nr:trypsin-like serine protease [FCB group bacterium]
MKIPTTRFLLIFVLFAGLMWAQNDRIVGGTEVDPPFQYTWMAAVFPGPYLCGGTLIDDEWIVTAAHCVEGIAAADTEVILGAHELWNPYENPGVRVTMNVTDIYIHPAYDNLTQDNDLALLHLDGIAPADFTPLPLISDPTLDDAGNLARVMGWGTTSSGGDVSPVLLEVDVPIISNTVCNEPAHYGGWVTDNMICAGDIVDGGEDSCQGDSGGPLMVDNGRGWELVGIVSWGIGCAEPAHPGVYTRVYNYLSWLDGYLPSSDISGCTDAGACNYNPDATIDDGSCAYDVDCNGDCGGTAFVNECGCVEGDTGLLTDYCYGCTDPGATNYDPLATIDDGSCLFPSQPVELFVGDIDLQAGSSGSFDISMTNDDPVGGFQFTLVIDPAIAHLVSVATTERTADWMVNGSPDTGVILGFSLAGLSIAPGSGPIVSVEVYGDSEGIADMCLDAISISDPSAQNMDAITNCGVATVGVVELFVGDLSVSGGGTGLLDISMTNEGPIAGFQFSLTFNPAIGQVIDVVTTGRTTDWMVSANSSTGMIIGFSLMGTMIEPGTGPIIQVEVQGGDPGTADACLSDIVLSNSEGGYAPATAECGLLTVGATEIYVGSAQIIMDQTGTFEISITNDLPVAGFQFEIIVDPAIASVVSVTGTPRTTDWAISNGGNTILGFSFSGSVIDPGEGPVAIVTLNGDGEGQSPICLDSIVLSGVGGVILPAVAFCGDLEVIPGILGDVNQDGVLNVIDIVIVVDIIFGAPASDYQLWAADVNGDGEINVIDVVSLVELVLNSRSLSASV